MLTQDTLDRLEQLGFGADIGKLEDLVMEWQDAAANGTPLVTDTQYDMMYSLLKEVMPESEVFKRNWEADASDLDDNDEILASYRMMSINTIKSLAELAQFKQALEHTVGNDEVTVLASIKENGHAIRAVYRYGELVSGSTRGRYKKGRDITRHLRAVLPRHIDRWNGIRLMEVRGEMLVSYKDFESLKGKLKTPLSAVTSLTRESVTDDELQYLNCVCYKLIPCSDSQVVFHSLYDEFHELYNCGFQLPEFSRYTISLDTLDNDFEQILEDFSSEADKGLKYAADGIVVAINDTDTFEAMGVDGNHYLGNFAIKMGRHWETNVYKSTIEDIEFMPGKKYFTPKAHIVPVVTSTGAQVSVVPLYNIWVMETLGLTPGAEVYFKFGGETGVTLCDANGVQVGDM